jgi:hypothetical protein
MTDAINAQSDVLTERELDCVSGGGMDLGGVIETVKQNQPQSALEQLQSALELFGR